jgi:hypothetical protein
MVSFQVLPSPQLIFPSKTCGFLEFILKFQWQKSLRNQYFPHFESKSYQINSIKSSASRSFQTTSKAHSNSFEIFSYDFPLIFNEKIFNIQELWHRKSKRSWNQAHAPLLIKSFPKTPRTQSKASRFRGSHN